MRTRKLAKVKGHRRLSNLQVKAILQLPEGEKKAYIKALKTNLHKV